MSIRILILTHKDIGDSILNAAKQIISVPLPLDVQAIAANYDCVPENLIAKIDALITGFETDDNILMFADLFGATPSNIAQHFNTRSNVRLISGLNLPMLIKTLNYSDLPFDEICQKALSGGQEGIMLCEPLR